MTNVPIHLLRSVPPGAVPNPAAFSANSLAVNIADGIVFWRDLGNVVRSFDISALTQPPGTSSFRLATNAFVQQEIAGLEAGAPASFDTLQELAGAIGNDPNFAATI